MATPPNVTPVYVDSWDLRCIFNTSWLPSRASAGELRQVARNKVSYPKWRTDGAGSQNFAYIDKNDDEVATFHCYHKANSLVSEPDPLTVTIGKIRYMRHSDKLKCNPETKLFPNNVPCQKRYGCFRRLQCCRKGPKALWKPSSA